MKRIGGFISETPVTQSALLANSDGNLIAGSRYPRQSTWQNSGFGKAGSHFKVPTFDNIPAKRGILKPAISPSRLVQTGRVKNHAKVTQQSKMSFLPRRSFIHPRRTLTCSRGNQSNPRKEIVKKMVSLAEYALKENKEIKSVTPLKLLAGLTPKVTPKCKGHLVLSEYKKECLRTPAENVFRSVSRSNNPTPVILVKKLPMEANEESAEKPPDDLPNDSETLNQILRQLRIYNTGVGFMCGKLKILEECFEKNIKDLPDYQLYEEFCLYQSKKEELYSELMILENTLKETVKKHTAVGQQLKEYVKKRKEIFDKRTKLHKNFEEVVKAAIEKCEVNQGPEKIEETILKDEEEQVATPQLRKSARLSQNKKTKGEIPISIKTRKRRT